MVDLFCQACGLHFLQGFAIYISKIDLKLPPSDDVDGNTPGELIDCSSVCILTKSCLGDLFNHQIMRKESMDIP